MKRVSVSFGLGAMLASHACAGIGPENVVLVVNGDSANSVVVANEYVRLREIPANNIVFLHHLSSIETTTIDQFRSEVLSPVLDAIAKRGLADQIDCVTYSVDLPYAIDVRSDTKGHSLPQVITPIASINGLTYLNEWVMRHDTDYLHLDINRYVRKLLPLANGKPLTADEQALYDSSVTAYDHHEYAKAISGLTTLLQTPRNDPNIAYNLACSLSLSGQLDEAVAALRKAVSAGWRNYGQTSSDPDLAPLKNHEGFKQVLRLIQGAHIEVQPGVPFHHSFGWNASGEPASEGPRYLLSTVLGIDTGRGNSVDEVLNSLRRSKKADFTAPKGTIYFEKNGDVRSTTRQWGFQPAVDELKRLGVEAVVESGTIPQGKSDVAGAMIGISDFDWPKSGSTILPGAICEHLTSYGGIMSKGAGQTPCTEFIRNGSSGTSGTVTEPYALQEKFPTPFIHVQYAKGFTLAESFYQSVSGPYQLLIIGDPLCRPWAKRAQVKLSGLQSVYVVKGKIRIRATLSPAMPERQVQLYLDGKWLKNEKPGAEISLDTTSLKPGPHDISVVITMENSAASSYRAKSTFTIKPMR